MVLRSFEPRIINKMVEPDIEMRDSAPLRRLNVKSMQGQVRTVELPGDSYIRDLKVKVAQVFNVQPERQRLIFQGKLLKDDTRLSEYVKEDGLTVHMMAKAEDLPRAPEGHQSAGPQPGPQVDPAAGMFGAMGGVQQVMFPEGMQAFQMQFGPSFQYIQGMQPGMQPGTPTAIPVQIRFQPGQPIPPQAFPQAPSQGPPQGPPQNQVPQASVPQQGQREERKVREIVLPFAHVHNLGQIVNGMMGPNTSFPHPPMPQLPVSRNTLVLLGGFLYNYQFQLMRLIPFLSRLADLLQRESLITEAQQRADLQRFSRAMGAAMREINLATQPVVDLFQMMEIGPAPGQYHIRVHDTSVVSQSEAVPRPNQSNVSAANPGQAMLNSLLNPANMPADSPLARMAPTLQQAMSGGMGNMSLRDLMIAANVHENEEDLPLMEFMYNLTMPELTVLMNGDVAPLDRIRPAAVQNLRQTMGGMDTPEGRERVMGQYQQYLQSHLIFPDAFRSRQRPGFDYLQATTQVVRKAVSRLVALVLEDSSNEFGSRFKREFQLRVGEWVETVIAGMEGGVQTMEQLLKAQMEASMAEMGGGEGMAPLLGMSNAIVQQLLASCLQARRLEREAMDPTAGLIETWSAVVETDAKLQAAQLPQGPLSRAYRALDALRQPEPIERIQPKKLLRTLLAQSLQDASVSLQGAEMSSDLSDAFIGALEQGVRVRVSNDPDFDLEKYRNIQQLLRR